MPFYSEYCSCDANFLDPYYLPYYINLDSILFTFTINSSVRGAIGTDSVEFYACMSYGVICDYQVAYYGFTVNIVLPLSYISLP